MKREGQKITMERVKAKLSRGQKERCEKVERNSKKELNGEK